MAKPTEWINANFLNLLFRVQLPVLARYRYIKKMEAYPAIW